MNQKLIQTRILLAMTMLIFLASPELARASSDVKEIKNKYLVEANPILRRNLIKQLSMKSTAKSSATNARSLAAPSTITPNDDLVELLTIALDDSDPTVVSKVILLIGDFGLTAFNQDLISLFHSSFKKFGAYGERVQESVIITLGKTGGSNAKILFNNVLKKNDLSLLKEQVLSSIRIMNDRDFIKPLEAFERTMLDLVRRGKTEGENPLTYATAERYARQARTIIETLVANRGIK